MFGHKSRTHLSQLEQLIDTHERILTNLRRDVDDRRGISERRWDYLTGELKRADREAGSVPDDKIEIAHVDAPNIKVKLSVRKVVQALADHHRLGFVPEAESEIVLLNGTDE